MVGILGSRISWAFLAIAYVIHLNFILSLSSGMLNWLFYDTKYLVGQGADFFSYYQAGYNVLNGLDPYSIPADLAVPYLYPFRYLPYFAYSFGAILNLTTPIRAYWVWIAVLIVAVWLAVLRTRSLAKSLNRPDWERNLAMGMWFVFTPIYIELFVGQVTLIAAILVFIALTPPSLVDGRKTRETFTISWILSALTKTIPYFIAPVFLAAGRVRTVLFAVIVTVLAIFAVPAGWESLQFFLAFNSARSTYITPYPGDHSLKMLLYYSFGEFTTDFGAITVLLVVIFIGLTIFVTLYSRDVWACAGMFSLSYFFIMLDVWEHHYTFLLPFLVLAYIRGQPEDRLRWVPLILALVMSVPIMPLIEFLSGLGPSVHPINWSPIWQIILHSSKVVPALFFYVWLMVTALKSPRTDSPLDSIFDIFRNVWVGLIEGCNPTAKGGVLIRREIETEQYECEATPSSEKTIDQ